MAARRLTVEILGEARKLNTTLGQVDDRLGKFGKNTERVGKGIATLFAADALRRGLGVIVGAAQEAAAVARQTETVIKSTGGAAGLSAKGFADLAAQISKTAAVDDDLIQAGANVLATFTNIKASGPEKIFQRAEQAAVDMAAAMNHGEVTAEGLQSANIQLGKALQDPIKGITALTRVGVTFSEQQKQQIAGFVKSGQVAKAQGVILAEVNKEFAGSAAASATSAKRFTVAVGNLEESLGGALLPVMEQGATVAAKLAEGFTDLDKATGGLASKLTLGAVGVAGLGVVAGKTLKFVKESKEAWLALRAAKLANVAITPAVVAAETATGAAASASGASAAKAAAGFGAARTALAALGSAAGPIAAAVAGFVALAFAQSKVEKAMDHQADGLSRSTRAWHDNVVAQDRYMQLSEDGKKTFDEIDAKIRAHNEQNRVNEQRSLAAAAAQAILTQRAQEADPVAAQIAKRTKEWTAAVKDATAKLVDAIPAFEGYTRQSDVTAKGIVRNLRAEVGGYSTWAVDVQRLLKRGADPKFIQELSTKGPAYVHAMATASDRQLATAQKFFHDRTAAMRDLAIANLRAAGQKAPGAFVGAVLARQHTTAAALSAAAKSAGLSWAEGLSAGLNSPKASKSVYNAAHHLTTVITGATRYSLKIYSPSQVAYGFGEQYALGFAKGLEDKINALAPKMSGAIGGSVPSSRNRSIVHSVFSSMFGWGGSQLSAADQLIMHESGYRNTAQNPTSTAYGMFQFLNGTWGSTGVGKTSDPRLQAIAGGRYIRSRYGSPAGAWNFWQRHHWYHGGGTLPEDIFGWGPSGATYSLQRGEKVTARGGSSSTVTIERGAIQIQQTVYASPGQSVEQLAEIMDTRTRAAVETAVNIARARRGR